MSSPLPPAPSPPLAPLLWLGVLILLSDERLVRLGQARAPGPAPCFVPVELSTRELLP